jgi:hypothetical protein
MLAQGTQRMPSMRSPWLAWPECGVHRWTSGDKVGHYTNYHQRPSCRYTGTLKGWPGNGGSTGGKRAHQNPVVFTVDGGDSTVDGGLDWLYSCGGSTWMWDNDLRKVPAMRRTREGAHQRETARWQDPAWSSWWSASSCESWVKRSARMRWFLKRMSLVGGPKLPSGPARFQIVGSRIPTRRGWIGGFKN